MRRLFFCFLYVKTARRSGHSIFFGKTGVTWNLRCLEKYRNQKVSKTKDLDMVKNFFCDAPLFSGNCAGITLSVCRNRYNSYESVGFVPGGSIFGTVPHRMKPCHQSEGVLFIRVLGYLFRVLNYESRVTSL
jgi:hypothetical protein